MKRRKIGLTIGCLFLTGLLGLGGCSSPSSASAGNATSFAVSEAGESSGNENAGAGEHAGSGSGSAGAGEAANPGSGNAEPDGSAKAGSGDSQNVQDLVYESTMELQYAENFTVDYYEGGYTMLSIYDGTKILVVPEGKEEPANVEEDVIVLQRPIKNLYLVASSVMDMFADLDAMDSIRLSGQKLDGWYIDEARDAMERGDIIYAGKYNKPDYELIVSEDCSLAIENMMISHSPEVLEKMESFGIPAMIEYSSYESHPLGRVEWIKFFGALVGKEEAAEEAFAEQLEILERVTADEKTGKTVAFFFITSNGLVQARQSSDYVPKMIELAGGKYIFENLGDPESSRSTVNVQMEEFYHVAKDADVLIYNSSIDGGVDSIDALIDKSGMFADFKAVKEGNVWCTTNDMYQQSMSIGYLIEDMHSIFTEDEDAMEYMKYLFPLE